MLIILPQPFPIHLQSPVFHERNIFTGNRDEGGRGHLWKAILLTRVLELRAAEGVANEVTVEEGGMAKLLKS